MAYKTCPDCGSRIFEHGCVNCNEVDYISMQGVFDSSDEYEFTPCSRCDGHDACADFGCAIELGLGRMVHREPGDDWD